MIEHSQSVMYWPPIDLNIVKGVWDRFDREWNRRQKTLTKKKGLECPLKSLKTITEDDLKKWPEHLPKRFRVCWKITVFIPNNGFKPARIIETFFVFIYCVAHVATYKEMRVNGGLRLVHSSVFEQILLNISQNWWGFFTQASHLPAHKKAKTLARRFFCCVLWDPNPIAHFQTVKRGSGLFVFV